MQRERHLSRRVAQRIARSVQINEKVREAVRGLNWLAGYETEENSFHYTADALQEEVLSRAYYLGRLSLNLASLEALPKPEAALKALLHGNTEYDCSVLPTTLAACSLERISIPESLSDAPSAMSLLDGDALRYLQCPEQMLKANEDLATEAFQPYWDPLLKNDRRIYK